MSVSDTEVKINVVPLTDNRLRFIGVSFDNKVDLTTIGAGWWRDGRQSKLDAFKRGRDYIATHSTGDPVNSLTVGVSAYVGKWKVRAWRNGEEIINRDDVDVDNPATWRRPEEAGTPPSEQPPAGDERPEPDTSTEPTTTKKVTEYLKKNTAMIAVIIVVVAVVVVVASSGWLKRLWKR